MSKRTKKNVKKLASQIVLVLFGLGFVGLLSRVAPVQAALVANMSDVMDAQLVNAPSNHLINFDTPTGAANGTQIVLTFGSGMDLSSLTENDIDIEDDGVDFVTAPDCTGAEAMGVNITGQIITFELCAGDGAVIAGTSTVTIEIGDNATSSGIGANQIINPAIAGSFPYRIDGSFGDIGFGANPIIDGNVSINAQVSGGGGPGGPGSDPPSLNHSCDSETTDGFTVHWSSDEFVQSHVRWGETVVHELGDQYEANYLNADDVGITGLNADTLHYYEVEIIDNDNEHVVGNGTCTTASADELFIFNVRAENVTDTTAEIWYETNLDSDSLTNYGLTPAYEVGSEYDGVDTLIHVLYLTGLTPGTRYYYEVHSETFEGLEDTEGPFTFTTLAEPPPIAGLLDAEPNLAQMGIDLFWTPPLDPDYAGYILRRSEVGYPGLPTEGTFIYDGLDNYNLDLNVVPGVLYYYCAFAYQTDGDFAAPSCDSAMLPIEATFHIKLWPEKRILNVDYSGDPNLDTLVELTLRHPGNTTDLYTLYAWTNHEGEADVYIDTIPLGIYDFGLKGLSHLNKVVHTIELFEVGTEVDGSFGETYFTKAGDVNGGGIDFQMRDEFVNSLDVSVLLADVYTNDMVADLNQDYLVNSLDFSVLLANVYVFGEE